MAAIGNDTFAPARRSHSQITTQPCHTLIENKKISLTKKNTFNFPIYSFVLINLFLIVMKLNKALVKL